MEIEFDPAKDKANIAKHGVSLALASGFDFDAALIQTDDSEHYGEVRFIGLGPIGERTFVFVWTERGEAVRAISLRPAEPREVRKWLSSL